jgi:uncharacterized protein YerC
MDISDINMNNPTIYDMIEDERSATIFKLSRNRNYIGPVRNLLLNIAKYCFDKQLLVKVLLANKHLNDKYSHVPLNHTEQTKFKKKYHTIINYEIDMLISYIQNFVNIKRHKYAELEVDNYTYNTINNTQKYEINRLLKKNINNNDDEIALLQTNLLTHRLKYNSTNYCKEDIVDLLPDNSGKNTETLENITREIERYIPKIHQNIIPYNPEKREIENEITVETEKIIKNIRDDTLQMQSVIDKLLKQTVYLKQLEEQYHYVDDLKNKINKLQFKRQLYLNAVRFDISKIDILPEDVICLIKEYIGAEFLTEVKKHVTLKNVFPNPRQQMFDLLSEWTVKNIRKYKTRFYMNFDISYSASNRRYYYHFQNKLTGTRKQFVIDNLLSNTSLLSFYEFLRDVYLISKIQKDNKVTRKEERNTSNIAPVPAPTQLLINIVNE